MHDTHTAPIGVSFGGEIESQPAVRLEIELVERAHIKMLAHILNIWHFLSSSKKKKKTTEKPSVERYSTVDASCLSCHLHSVLFYIHCHGNDRITTVFGRAGCTNCSIIDWLVFNRNKPWKLSQTKAIADA